MLSKRILVYVHRSFAKQLTRLLSIGNSNQKVNIILFSRLTRAAVVHDLIDASRKEQQTMKELKEKREEV